MSSGSLIRNGHDVMVRDLDAGRLADLCRTHELPQPVIRKPSLEDILLTLLRQNRNQQSNEFRPAVPVPASGGTSVP